MISFLQGVRIIALTQVWAGGWMGGVLADMGAEVIKIESNKKLDILETYWRLKEMLIEALTLMVTIAGVKSCTLNLKHPKG